MAFKRVGDTWVINWQEFSPEVWPSLGIDYRINGGSWVPAMLDVDNSYETAIDANADELNRHTLDFPVTPDMIGLAVEIRVKDLAESDIYVDYGPFDIISGAATSAIVTPSSVSVQVEKIRQFTVAYYAADGLVTTIHDPTVWSVDDGGTIGEDTGLFAAGAVVGGPFTVTATAGLISDTATVNVVEKQLSIQAEQFSFATLGRIDY